MRLNMIRKVNEIQADDKDGDEDAEDQEKTRAATCKHRSSFLCRQWKDETSQEGYKEDKNNDTYKAYL